MHRKLLITKSAGETKQMIKSHEQTGGLVGTEISKPH